MNMENKRKNKRVQMLATVDLYDGTRVSQCDVVNISMTGIEIERIPVQFLRDLPKKFTALIAYRGKTVKVGMFARWYQKDNFNTYATAGFEVCLPLQSYQQFISASTGLIIEKEASVWDTVVNKQLSRA